IQPRLFRPVDDRFNVTMQKSDEDGSPPTDLRYRNGRGEPENVNGGHNTVLFIFLHLFLKEMEGITIQANQCNQGNFDHHQVINFPFHNDHWNTSKNHPGPACHDKFFGNATYLYNLLESNTVEHPQHAVKICNKNGSKCQDQKTKMEKK